MSNNNHIISEIEQYMLPYLNNEQLEHLRKILSSLLIDQKKQQMKQIKHLKMNQLIMNCL